MYATAINQLELLVRRCADLTERAFGQINLGLQNQKRWLVAAGTLLLLQVLLVGTHVAWMDEWQALQIALQSPTLPALFANLRYEGHPALWYLLLRLLGLLLPYMWVLAVAQFMVALAMQATILFASPFQRFERLLIGGSYFILFEFGTLSRGMGLGAFLTVAFFAAHWRALTWLILALLPNVDALFGMISIVGILITKKDGRFSWLGAGLWALGSLFAAWTVFPAADVKPTLEVPVPFTGLVHSIVSFGPLFIPLHTYAGHLKWGGILPWNLSIGSGLIFLAFAFHQTRKTRLHLLLLAGFIVAVLLFRVFIYPLSVRHLALIPLLLILLKWRELRIGGTLEPLFRMWLLVIALAGAAVSAISFQRPFDRIPEVADYIANNGLQDKHWVSYPDSMAAGVFGILDREAHTLGKGCTQSFLRWDYRNDYQELNELDAAFKQVSRDYGRYYLVTSYALERHMTVPLQRIAHFSAGYDGRPYYLYIVAPQLRESNRQPPKCEPVRIHLSEATLLR
ncbi:hypothetical protein G7077_11635 [Sphingomonas piscis]|uniref:Glycosyltransferase RgtA/B/C/D-like domain-containing protein n=1 Tax=Sphingomonas piscis TaxID=2714943 RepID=A0A6G7YRT5_9SPHN|nr:hypothetical protein [Sphingomonas piscis]QIK79458.1 hypothetical protein G7077_11635 [Sphingomonas piscis]